VKCQKFKRESRKESEQEWYRGKVEVGDSPRKRKTTSKRESPV